MHTAHCREVEWLLGRQPGVLSVYATSPTATATVTYDPNLTAGDLLAACVSDNSGGRYAASVLARKGQGVKGTFR